MSRNDLCFCGSGKKQKKCHDDIEPRSRAAKILMLYRKIDLLIENHYKNTSFIPKCHSGCGECCYDTFDISMVEFKLVVRELKTWNKNEIFELKNIIESHWEHVMQNYPDYANNLEKDATYRNDIIFNQVQLTRQKMEIPCPFINSHEETCRVYSAHPSICRLHGTTFYINREYSVCSFIPSNIVHSKTAANVLELRNEYERTNVYFVDGDENPRITRRYPIFYWLKLTFELSNDSIIIPEELRDFRTPIETANNLESRHYERL